MIPDLDKPGRSYTSTLISLVIEKPPSFIMEAEPGGA
jgi:hypothetical protein